MSFARKKGEEESGSAGTAVSKALGSFSTSAGSVASASTGGERSSGVDAYIGKGSKVVGTLTFTGPVEISGEVEGEVQARDRLVIGQTALVRATVNGTDVLVEGTVEGDIVASERLSLKKSAVIRGNINCSVLSMDEGVVFDGSCKMGEKAGGKSEPSKAA